MLVLLYTKFYILGGVVVYLMVDALIWKLPQMKAGLISLVLIGIAALILVSPLGDSIGTILSGKREEALKAAVFGEAQNQVFYHPVDSEWPRIVAEIPATLANAFFRPLPFEAGNNPLVLLASFENALFLLSSIIALIIGARSLFQRTNVSLWFYILTLAFIIGFTSPVTGGLMRYKTAFISFSVWMITSGLSVRFHNNNIESWIQRCLMRQ
jgi:hypothetical protein